MKHILVYLVVAVCIFGLMGLYFAQNDKNIENNVVAAEANVPKQSTVQVGVLLDDLDDADTVAFVDSLSGQLGKAANITVSECSGDAPTQMSYYKKMLSAGCRYLFVEVFDAGQVDEMIALAAKQGATLFLMNANPTAAQITAYDAVYSIGYAESDRLVGIANALADYWSANREEMDYKTSDDVLSYAVVTDSGFAGTEEQEELEKLLAQRGCVAELVRDSVTEYLNYNFEAELDRIYFANAELILFADSADAEKAYHYYHDPSEYSSETPKLCLMTADKATYSLHENNQILLACGNGGDVLGRMAAAMVTTLANGETLSLSTVGTAPINEGRTYLCGDVVLRNIIISEETTDEE